MKTGTPKMVFKCKNGFRKSFSGIKKSLLQKKDQIIILYENQSIPVSLSKLRKNKIMGSIVGKYLGNVSPSILTNFGNRKRKCTEEIDSDEEGSSESENATNSPKRRKVKKKLLSTPQYIYQALFKEGSDSDITLVALGKEWKLHKIYLCQSPYFASMFSGSWKETNENTVHIKIVDPKITVESLYIVLGSLYFNEIDLESGQLVSVLATAALFQLDSMSERCAEVMIETLDMEVVLYYYEAALEYGVTSLKEAACNWLLANLLTYVRNYPEVLSMISIDLMTTLVSSPNLFVVQTESSVYFMLQTWLYYILNPQEKKNENNQQVLDKSSEYFQSIYNGTEFLLTEEGKKYAPPFKALRYRHLTNLLDDVNRIRTDRIVPDEWMRNAIITAWMSLLRFDHGIDRGPRQCTDDEICADSLRCGRILHDDGEHVWRWMGFYGGLDLVWTCKNHTIKVRRNHRGNDGSVLSMANRRFIACRVTVAKLNKLRQTEYIEKSNLQVLQFSKHDEVVIMNFKSDIVFPIYLLGEIVFCTPE